MDNNGDWTATALFSPSKARAQQAQAKDWASLDAWLAKKYGKRLPQFERNEETLQALLSVANLNENADDLDGLVERVQKAASLTISKRSDDEEKVYFTLTQHLDQQGQEGLIALAEASVVLGSSDITVMRHQVFSLTTDQYEAREALARVQTQRSALEREEARLKELLSELSDESFETHRDWPEQTAEWMRNTKQLKAKVAEYEERLVTARANSLPSPSISDVVEQVKTLTALREQTAALNSRIAAFQDLPTDGKAARKKLEQAREELRALTVKRDQMFEKLVDNGD